MKNKIVPIFTFSVVAIMLGVTLYKQFNFTNLSFEKPALAIIYIIVFVFSIYAVIKNIIKPSAK